MDKYKSLNISYVIIILLFVTPFVSGVTIQISEDNLSWHNITDVKYDGVVDENETFAGVHYLQEDTKYYFRGRLNDSGNWSYIQTKTNTGWGEDKMLAVIFALFFTMVVFGVMGYLIKGYVSRVVFWSFSIIELVNMSFILYVDEIGGDISSLLKMNFYIIITLAFGMGMIMLIIWMIKLISNEDQEIANEKWN